MYFVDLYRSYIKTELATKTQYRANTLLWLIGLLIEPIIYLVVWSNVAQAQGGSVQGYTAADFAGYYLILLFIRQATVAPGPWEQAYRIRTGLMTSVLLRPVHPMHYDLAESNMQKVVSLFALLPMMLAIALLFGARIAPPWWSALAFIPALVLASFLRFFFQYALSFFAFWTDRIDALWQIYATCQTFFGGILAPLVMLPPTLRLIATILPFRWIFTFPIELMLGRLTPEQIGIGFAVQIAWLFASMGLMHMLWRAGVRRYSAFGG